VICRAGALTVAELAAAGKPAIFVPYPHAVDDHQRKNAEYMVNQGAAAMILQDRLEHELLPLLTHWQARPNVREEMASLAKKSGYTHATTRVVERCLHLVGE
jgi:UDP-N-acetylglucosamine--N-acetylmuramyl-(pentapeptide) pyrophosphoryl-undecaprenol N-acetylglucosamine transferase